MGNAITRQRQQVIEQTAIGCLLCWHFGATIEAAEQRAREARKVADLAACEAWNIRMKGWRRSHRHCSATRSTPAIEVRCNGCRTHNAVDLSIPARQSR